METQNVNSKELLRHAFHIMDGLDCKNISIEEANAQANLIKQACNLFRYGLDRILLKEKLRNINTEENI